MVAGVPATVGSPAVAGILSVAGVNTFFASLMLLVSLPLLLLHGPSIYWRQAVADVPAIAGVTALLAVFLNGAFGVQTPEVGTRYFFHYSLSMVR